MEASGPAARAGLAQGDRIHRINGLDITSEAGGRAFLAVAPGDAVRLEWRRDGAAFQATLLAEAPPRSAAVPAAGQAARLPTTGQRGAAGTPLRFSGSVGNAHIEVRSPERVLVTETVAGEEIEIVIGGGVVRIRLSSRRGS